MTRCAAGTIVLLAVASLAFGCGREAPGAADAPAAAYRLTPAEPQAVASCEEASCRPAGYVLWVAPERGWIRSESADETGFETTTIFAHGARVTLHGSESAEIRIGPPSFVGRPSEAAAIDAVRSLEDASVGDRVQVDFGGNRVTLVVDKEIALESPEAQRLFEIPRNGTISSVLRPGTPAKEVDAYWLGDRFGERQAVTAIERASPGEQSYAVFYGRRAPTSPEEYGGSGQLQLVSLPLDGPEARRTLEHVRDRPHTTVTLADGVQAQLVEGSPGDRSYVVVTPTTLVGFGGVPRAEAIRVTRALRPIRS